MTRWEDVADALADVLDAESALRVSPRVLAAIEAASYDCGYCDGGKTDERFMPERVAYALRALRGEKA